MEQNRKKLEQNGLGLAAISYDSPAILRNFAERKGIHFPLLSDAHSEVIRAFGILNREVPENSPFHGIPVPVTYIVDAKGIVRSRHFEEDFRQRPTTGYILSRDLGISTESGAAEVAAKHLRLRASATDAVVRGGERIRLILEGELPAKMHVYAPGVTGYIPIEWKVEESPAYTASAPVYPSSKMLRLEAIRETVPVYEGRFTLVRDVVIGQPGQVQSLLDSAGKLTVRGSFRYQACDDRKCYVPENVPLSWTFRFESHDPTRAPQDLRRK